jgi:hypothetical protein
MSDRSLRLGAHGADYRRSSLVREAAPKCMPGLMDRIVLRIQGGVKRNIYSKKKSMASDCHHGIARRQARGTEGRFGQCGNARKWQYWQHLWGLMMAQALDRELVAV